jgi:hypothetical protein
MDEDFFLTAGANRWQALEAQKAQTLADLQAAKANFDYESAGDAVERLSVINQRQSAISQLHNQHAQALNPPPAPELTPQMRMAKDLDQMDWTDTWELAKKSAKTPQELEAIKAGFQKGMAEITAHPTARRGG